MNIRFNRLGLSAAMLLIGLLVSGSVLAQTAGRWGVGVWEQNNGGPYDQFAPFCEGSTCTRPAVQLCLDDNPSDCQTTTGGSNVYWDVAPGTYQICMRNAPTLFAVSGSAGAPLVGGSDRCVERTVSAEDNNTTAMYVERYGTWGLEVWEQNDGGPYDQNAPFCQSGAPCTQPAGVKVCLDDSSSNCQTTTGSGRVTFTGLDGGTTHTICLQDTPTYKTVSGSAGGPSIDERCVERTVPHGDETTAMYVELAVADLEVTVVNNSSTPVIAGDSGTNSSIQFTITNNGPATATNIATSLNQDIAWLYGPCIWVADDGNLSLNSTYPNPVQLDWDIASLAPGESASLSLVETCYAQSSVADGTVVNTTLAITALDQVDPVPDNDDVTAGFTIEREVDIVVEKTGTPNVVAGVGTDNVVHTVTVTNDGPSDVTGAAFCDTPTLDLTGITVKNGKPTGSTGSVSALNADPVNCAGGWYWTGVDLADGASATLTLTLTVGSSAIEQTIVDNVVFVTSTGGEDETGEGANSDSASTVVTREATIDVAKTWTEGGGEVDLTLNCDTLQQQTATTSSGVASFKVTGFPNGEECVVTETIPDFYAPTYTGCTIDPVTSGQTYNCGIENAPTRATFKVIKDYSDDLMDDVTVTLTCNTGLPLEQTFEISENNPVNFVLTTFIEGTPDCEVTENGAAEGYTPVFDNGETTSATSCVYTDVTAGAYTCTISNAADDATYTVTKEWVVPDQGFEEMNYDVPVTISCTRDITSANTGYYDGGSWSGELGDMESVTIKVDTYRGDAYCTATEYPEQSGVESESSGACINAKLVAGGSASCKFTNTVFFEGIPTLSQYGLALLALLMLGVGFVGFRRFV